MPACADAGQAFLLHDEDGLRIYPIAPSDENVMISR